MTPHFSRIRPQCRAITSNEGTRSPSGIPGPARLPVAIAPLPAAFLRGNDRFHPRPFGMDKNLVRVAAPVRQKSFRRKSVNQSDCPSAIRCRALCGKSPDRHAMRIRSQMRDFVLSPPLRGSCPGCLLSRPPHVGEPRNDRRRPSAMRGPARQSEFQAAAPIHHYRANG